MDRKKVLKLLESINLGPAPQFPCTKCPVEIVCKDRKIFSSYFEESSNDQSDLAEYKKGNLYIENGGVLILNCPYLEHYTSYFNILFLKKNRTYRLRTVGIEKSITKYLNSRDFMFDNIVNQQ